ncbi:MULTISPECIES: hypothetical protein [Bacillus]|uniref:hypothetical protein n=1 Tax=Bacillus TaxID=1386 RepID=UPI00031F78F2|nr:MULTISPECIES: hypothetical protein [Bacillus]
MQLHHQQLAKRKPFLCISTTDYEQHNEFPLEIYRMKNDNEILPTEFLTKITTFDDLIHFIEEWD